MQNLRLELQRAQDARREVTNLRAAATLDGIILALDWAIEQDFKCTPTVQAMKMEADPLDHDGDGHKGGSLKRKRK